MPKFTLRTLNNTLFTVVALERASADDVLAEGIRGALMIAADEVHIGTTASAVEVLVEDEANQQLRRSVVSVSVASLAVGVADEKPFPEPMNDRQ